MSLESGFISALQTEAGALRGFQDGSPFLHKPKTWISPSLFSSVVSFSVDFVGQTPCRYILGVLPAQPPVATKTHCSNIVVMWKMFWASLCYLQHGSPAKRSLAFDRAGRLPCLGQDFKTQWFCHGWKSHPFVSWIVRSQKKETSAQLQLQDNTKRASLMLDYTLCKPPTSYNSRHPAFQT